jgi:hypothetical protein
MFEMTMLRARAAAERAARRRTAMLAERLRTEMPPGVAVEAVAEGVRLSGRGIGRRFALDPELRRMALRKAHDQGRMR